MINRNVVWKDADSLYINMVLTAPQSVHAKKNLGTTYIQSGRWEQGRKVLQEAVNIAPDHVPLIDAQGILAEHDLLYDDAERHYLRALALKPHYGTALSNLGRMYFTLGRYDKAATLFASENRAELSATSTLVYAMSMSKLGRYDEAIAVITKNFGQHPKDVTLQFALGYAYYKKGDKATADRYFATSRNPDMTDAEFFKSIENF